MQVNSRRSSLVALALALCGTAIPLSAQTLDYETQKQATKAVRFDTLEELRVLARTYKGRTIELRGRVKGVFTRGNGIALMLQLPDNQTILLDGPTSFRLNSAARPAAIVRILCKVEGVIGNEVNLTIVDGTDKIEDKPVIEPENQVIPEALVNTLQAPSPTDIIIAREAELPDRPTATSTSTVTSVAQVRQRGSNLSSRSLPRPRSSTNTVQPAANPYFGYGDENRAAYKALAKRFNPRLKDDMAEYIAASILAASQAHSLDPRFLAAVVQVESAFDPYAVSSAGAMGLGQLMPFNLKPLGVQNAWDPQQNLHGAAKLLRQNLNTYAKEPNGTLLAVAAYHAGVGAVNRAGKSIPKATTQRYVWKIYYAYRALAPELFQ